MPAQPPAVEARGVTKSFAMPRERVHTLKERALHPLRRSGYDVLRALRDVSFSVEPGEFFGIVGRNGSGKSTLLKCLAGIYATDRGEIYVDGRMSTFIELGVGFNMDLAARDNVVINATMLGLSQREARRRFERIIEFAELGDFVDLKLKNYSSGMLVRLAFSVMIQVDADILLIDEVLAVGDAAFQQKCYDEFARIRSRGTTVLLVTHDMNSVRRFCDRAMLLEHGHVVEIGDPERVGNRYLELNFDEGARRAEAQSVAEEQEEEEEVAEPREEEQGAAPPAPATAEHPVEAPERHGDGAGEIVEAWFEDEAGKRLSYLALGRRFTYVAKVRFNEDVADPLVGIEIYDDQRLKLFGCNNVRLVPAGSFAAGEQAVFRVSLDAVFSPGRYYITPALAHANHRVMDRRERFTTVVIAGNREGDWLTHLPFDIEIDRQTPLPPSPPLAARDPVES
jgi:ABC-2 type transport system ATP-binding protein